MDLGLDEYNPEYFQEEPEEANPVDGLDVEVGSSRARTTYVVLSTSMPIIPRKKTTSGKRKASADFDSAASESGSSSGEGAIASDQEGVTKSGEGIRRRKKSGAVKARRLSKIVIRPKRKGTESSSNDGDENEEEEDDDEVDDDAEEEEKVTRSRSEKKKILAIREKKVNAEVRLPVERAPGAGNIYYQGRNRPGGRNPWTSEEVELLHRCLRQFGTNWQRMMKQHGPEGKISRVFGLRTNVSLKDKAVNILKNLKNDGQPIPAYFGDVFVPESKLKVRDRPTIVISNGTDVEDDEDDV
ncbi:hypothetical protein JCM11491_001254 [Sporobolomyces phaffii]